MDPIVERVLKLIDGQVQQIIQSGDTVAKVLLVGGFGQSKYLLERAKARYTRVKLEDISKPLKRKREDSEPLQDSIEILRPPHAWTAVVRGAVLRGLEGDIIKGRKSRFNYGVPTNVPYDAEVHGGRKYFDRHEGRNFSHNVMQWALKRGETIKPNSTFSVDFTETWGGKRFPYACNMSPTIELYANDNEVPPQYLSRRVMSRVCVLEVNLQTVPRALIPNKQRLDAEGRVHHRFELEYQLEMSFGESELVFEVKVMGKSYGFAKTKFEAEKE